MRYILVITILTGLTLGDRSLANPLAEGESFGPRDNPHNWPDYGGTKDLSSPADMGLALWEVDALLERLMSMTEQNRARALGELLRNSTGSEKTLRRALWHRHEATNAEMRKAIVACRRKMASQKSDSDLLRRLVVQDPGHKELGSGTRGAIAILSLLEALRSLNTLAAYKIMIEFSPRHAGVFRREIGRMLVDRGLESLPALAYSRSHENSEIRMFAVKWIRDMNILLLSEQVKIKNPRRLAQLLEAYASINELKALEVTLSLTNHRSLFVRRAARKCIERYGKNTKWPIRRLYENTFSREPENDDNIAAMASELYEYFDQQRLQPQMTAFRAGKVAQKKGAYPKMEALYREVLLKSPMFPEKSTMAAGFLEYGRWLRSQNKERQALAKFTMAERLADPASEVALLSRAAIEWQQAADLQQMGVAEPSLYRRVLEKDPNHKEAARWYERLTSNELPFERYIYKILTVSFIIFLAGVLVAKRLRS